MGFLIYKGEKSVSGHNTTDKTYHHTTSEGDRRKKQTGRRTNRVWIAHARRAKVSIYKRPPGLLRAQNIFFSNVYQRLTTPPPLPSPPPPFLGVTILSPHLILGGKTTTLVLHIHSVTYIKYTLGGTKLFFLRNSSEHVQGTKRDAQAEHRRSRNSSFRRFPIRQTVEPSGGRLYKR